VAKRNELKKIRNVNQEVKEFINKILKDVG
jgi:hypothetical protein